MKNYKPISRTPQEVRASAQRHWEKIMEDVSNGIIDQVAIAQAMRWINDLDREEYQKGLADFMLKRKKWVIDPAKPSGDGE